MKVTLYIDELVYDMKVKNQNETSGIKDPEQKYRIQAGTEKTDELVRDILYAGGAVSSMLMRFLAHRFEKEASNDPDTGDALVYDFAPSERRQINRIPAIADLLHSLIVNTALARFYDTVAMYDLSKARNALAAEDMAALQPMIYEKMPPAIPTREDYGREKDSDDITV